MARSSRVTARDLRNAYRLLGECQELGDDPIVWRHHFFAGLKRLVGSDVTMGGEMAGGRTRRPCAIGTTEWGWEAGFRRDIWLRDLAEFAVNPWFHPLMNHVLQEIKTNDSADVMRQEVITDRDWYQSKEYQLSHEAAGTDAIGFSFVLIPEREAFSGLILNRRLGERQFDTRERDLVAHLHRDVAQKIGGALTSLTEPSPEMLSPRVKQVLRCLLEGDGDKQIAKRLNLSVFTVNQYVKTIFKHFQVDSRARLQARWLKRGWGINCRWAVSDSTQ
jgi:DNA-binding CsgD family transcriptional regulator